MITTCPIPSDTVFANGIKLAFDSFGFKTDPAVLLISGLGTQMIRWTPSFCSALADRGFYVIRYDNRDAGLSTHLSTEPVPVFDRLVSRLMAGEQPDVPYSLHDMAADAAGLLDALLISKAHVVGRSMGGMIAQILATDFADRVLSLTSIMSSTGNPALPPTAPNVMQLMTAQKPDPSTDLKGYIAQSLDFARAIAGNSAPFDETEHQALILEEARRAYDPAGGARQLAAMVTAGDRRARLSSVVAPTLVVHGSEDPLIHPAGGEDTAKAIPGAEFLLVDGMGHDIHPAFQDQILDAICRVAQSAPM